MKVSLVAWLTVFASVVALHASGADVVADVPLLAKPTPIPDESQVQEAVNIVKELCEEDVEALNAGTISGVDFAQSLMELSIETDDAAVKLVLFRNAFRQLLSGGDAKAATELFERTLDRFGGRFASKMASYSMSMLKNVAASPKSTSEFRLLLALVEELEASCGELAEAEGKLRSSPSDERAKRKLALSAIKLMDWDLALRTYAELGGERGSICGWELAEPGSRGDDCTFERCGDYWWGCIDGKDEQGLLFRSISIHASFWYRRALSEGKISGLKVALVKNRINRSKAWMGEPETSGEGHSVAESAASSSAGKQPRAKRRAKRRGRRVIRVIRRKRK